MQPDFATLKPVGISSSVPDFSTLKPVNPMAPQTATTEEGIKQNWKDIISNSSEDAKGFAPSLLQNTVGSRGIAGVAELPARTAAALGEYGPGGAHQAEKLYATAQDVTDKATTILKKAQTESDPVKKASLNETARQMITQAQEARDSADAIQKETGTTGGQALGTTLNAELTVATGAKPNLLGEASPLFKTLPQGASDINNAYKALRIGGKAIENAGLGVGFNTASNLENEKTVTEGNTSAALLGGLLPLAGEGASATKNLVQKAGPKTAESIIGALIKPLDKNFAYGKDPIRGILDEGITANSIDELGSKVDSVRKTVGQRIGEIGDLLSSPKPGLETESAGETSVREKLALDLTPALKPLDDAMTKAASLGNQALVDSLFNVKNALTHDLGLATDNASGRPIIQAGVEKDLANLDYNGAVKFLSDVTDHTKFTGVMSDDKALNLATKQVYGTARSLMNETASKIDPTLGTELKALNARYADLSSAKLAINHRELALKRANFISLAGKIGFGLTTAGALASGIISGDWATAGKIFVAGLGELGASKVANSPAVITRIAKFLNSLSPTEREGIIRATPVLKNYWDRFFHGGQSQSQ